MTCLMRDLVQIEADFKPSVQLPDDFYREDLNRHFVSGYIPTLETLDIFMNIRDSLQPGSDQRARIFSGTFGTGKSDLMLMVANYVTRDSDDLLMQPFYTRLTRLNQSKAKAIRETRADKPPFLLVLLQADTATTCSSFILDGLERALGRASLSHLMDKTYYRAALELLENWQQVRPENIERLTATLEHEHGYTLLMLMKDLQGPKADTALDIFRQAFADAIGVPFHAPDVIQRPADAFESVAARLIESGQYSGIFIICDEFTHLLQRLAESPTAADSKAIDNLAELAARSGSCQIHFFVVSLESLGSIQATTPLAQKMLERTGGRFILHELKSHEAEELVSGSIAKRVPTNRLFEGASGQTDDLMTLAMRLWSQRQERSRDREWIRQTVIGGGFPLHPLILYCLPRLNAALAQNERTMFSFLADEGRGLRGFIERTPGTPQADGWLPLLSLSNIFGYFEPNLKEKRLELLLAYQQACALLTPEQASQGIEGRILRALVMLEVVSEPQLKADAALLRQSLALSPASETALATALAQLEQTGAAYQDQSGRYRLVLPGRANPLELKLKIKQRTRELPGSPVELLNSLHPLGSIKAEEYNSQRGTDRKLDVRFTTVAGLQSPATLSTELVDKDGLAWYVLAETQEQVDRAKQDAVRLTGQHDQLVIAVPRHPTDLVVRFQRERALEELRMHPDYQGSDHQDLLRDGGFVGRDYVEGFGEARRLFDNPAKFEWFRGGRSVSVTTPAHMQALATTVMKDVFPKTPAHRTAQHLKATGISRDMRSAIDELLRPSPRLTRPGSRRKPPKDAILRDGAGMLGLIAQTGQEQGYEVFEVTAPARTCRESLEVWNALDSGLRAGTAWPAIVASLTVRPFGLYPSVLQIFAAAFYRFNREFLEVYEVSQAQARPIDVTGEVVIKLVEEPSRYTIRYQPLAEAQRKFLRGLVERALFPGKRLDEFGTSAALRNAVAQVVSLWTQGVPGTPGIPAPARNATLEEMTNLFGDQPSEVIEAAMGLLEVAAQPDLAATARALLERLPVAVRLPQESAAWDDESVERALAYLESACFQLKKFNKDFKAHLAAEIGQVFGLMELPHNWNDVLKVAIEWQREKAKNVRLSDVDTRDARDLLKALDDGPISFDQVFLNRLPNNFGLKVFDEWHAIRTKDEYLPRLRQAKATVEQVAQELAARRPRPPVEPPVRAPQPPGVPTPSVAGKVRLPKTPPTLPFVPPAESVPPIVAPLPARPEEQVEGEATVNSSQKVEWAFRQVQPHFDPLTTPERLELLRRLREKYSQA